MRIVSLFFKNIRISISDELSVDRLSEEIKDHLIE